MVDSVSGWCNAESQDVQSGQDTLPVCFEQRAKRALHVYVPQMYNGNARRSSIGGFRIVSERSIIQPPQSIVYSRRLGALSGKLNFYIPDPTAAC